MRIWQKNLIAVFILVAGCAPVAKDDANTITVWHWMSDRDQTFQELAKQYQDETQTKVKFELYAPSDAYTQRIKASAQTNTLPDIFGVLGEKRDLGSFIRSGYVADLTGDLSSAVADGSSWKDTFFEKALAINEFPSGNEYGVKPGIYGVPLDVTTIQMVYNKTLYAKAGLDPDKPPQTWEEFVTHSQALKEAGIPRLVSGFSEIWMIDALASNWAMNIMGQDKVFRTYQGKAPYTDPDWVRLFTLFKQMTDENILVDGAVTMVNKTAEQTFANERAAYAFNGSWCINVYKGMNPGLNYAAMLPPKVVPQNPMIIWGGAGSSFVVNERSPRKAAAIQFLQWLTAKDPQAYFSSKTENLPANKNTLRETSPILAQFGDDMDQTTHPNVYPVHESPVVTEAFDKGIQSILIGEKTPEAVAQEVQRIKEKEMRKKEPKEA